MRYFPLTDQERDEIRQCLGIRDTAELFAQVPDNKAYFDLDEIPAALTEDKLKEKFKNLAKANTYNEFTSFLGAGCYRHFIPDVVSHLSAKGELLTPYTPYQPEVSQGSLQAMFEYQTMITQLTGMYVANASLYDGGTAAAETLLLMHRKSRKKRFLIAESLHPEYREIIDTYIQNLDIEIETVPFDRKTGKISAAGLVEQINENIGGFIFQSPNFLGVIEDADELAKAAGSRKITTAQIVSEAMSLPFLTSPGENGVNIVAGEAQSFGLSMGYGGPHLGFIATDKSFLRQLPGRIVGETTDLEGRRGYVLTLSTREQHIKREKATSNICTNQAWCALRAGIYLATMGKQGMRKISKANHLNTAYFAAEIRKHSNLELVFTTDFFSEAIVRFKNSTVDTVLEKAEKQGLLPGVPLKWFFTDFSDCLLINFTEMHSQEDIDRLINFLGEIA